MAPSELDDPAAVQRAWAACFNNRDIEGMLALVEEGSTFVPQPGTAVTGADYRAVLEQYLAMGLPLSLSSRSCVVSGDIALVVADWTINGTAADGSEVNLAGASADVLRRGPGGWKYVIDNPFGTA